MFETIHGHLGQGLFLALLLVVVAGIIYGIRLQPVPALLTRVVHSLIALQIILGAILVIVGGLRGVSWVHPVTGVLAIGVLDMGARWKSPLRPGFQTAAVYALAAVLAILARAIALGRTG